MRKAANGFCFLFAVILLVSGCEKKPVKESTISVFGIGTVLVQPNMVQMNITLSNTAQTTKSAGEEVSKMVRQALAVLKNAGIEDKNISTASLTFNSEYEYAGRRILIGQKAEQRLSFIIEGINNDDEKVSAIIDNLIMINGIEINRINFNVKDNTEYYIRSRELAFQKAVEKAQQYADLSGLKIVKVLNVSEEQYPNYAPGGNAIFAQYNYDAAVSEGYNSTIIPTGELEITTRIFVEFLME